jgi:hypothetical protein
VVQVVGVQGGPVGLGQVAVQNLSCACRMSAEGSFFKRGLSASMCLRYSSRLRTPRERTIWIGANFFPRRDHFSYTLVYFPLFWHIVSRKIWQPCSKCFFLMVERFESLVSINDSRLYQFTIFYRF